MSTMWSCGQEKKTNIKDAVIDVFLNLIINKGPVLVIKPKNRYYCSNCGHEWTE
jgi:hypothetical protein